MEEKIEKFIRAQLDTAHTDNKQQAGGGPEVYGPSDFNVWRAQMEAVEEVFKRRTTGEHDAYLRGVFGDSTITAEARQAYMRKHRLRHENGVLVQDPEGVTAYGQVGRLGAQPLPHATGQQPGEMGAVRGVPGAKEEPRPGQWVAQHRAPGKAFTRAEVVAVIRAEKTRPQPDDSISALNRLQSIFENME